MKRDLVDILACPTCKSPLNLTVQEQSEGEVIRGVLHCRDCEDKFPIEDSIPNLLPPNLRS